MRAVTHIHTSYSWDSRSGVARLADALLRHRVELALVSDHNDFSGSLALRQLSDDRGLELSVPVAAEIRTDRGDVIVIFEGGEPPAVEDLLSWDGLPSLVRERDGLIWLPHPYQSHSDVEALAAEADIIEVFNARCDEQQNAQAADLCRRHGAVPGYGADAHRLVEVGRFSVDYEPGPTILQTLRSSPSCPEPVRSRRSDIMAAEMVNGFTRRRPTLVGYNLLRWAKHRARELTGTVPDAKG